MKIIHELRTGVHDVLVGINLLREGLDMPEVSLVAIFDADKEGFLRSERSLIQTIGRAARHVNGKAILYADKITPSMEKAIEETDRRRAKQIAFNIEHNITPTSAKRAITDKIDTGEVETANDNQAIIKAAAPILGIDWRDEDDIGELPKAVKNELGKDDWLIIDGQGAMSSEKTEQLIAESKLVIVPVLPSFFDIESTKRFLKNLQDIKRVRKGKVEIMLVANRVRSQFFEHGEPTDKVIELFDDIGQQPVMWVSERSIYQLLAENGLTVFDKHQKPYRDMQAQWDPIFEVLLADESSAKDTNAKNPQKKHNTSNWYE